MTIIPGLRVLDVGAGSGGAALDLAVRGCRVCAVDASKIMVARIAARASGRGLVVEPRVMDGQNLALDDAAFDAAISVFGVILFPDAVRGLREMRRVVRPGGKVAIVTWTEPQHYELAAQLRASIQSVCPDQPASGLPAQLRFRDRADFIELFHDAGFATPHIDVRRETLIVPSARWLGERLRFAPGMAAQLDRLGSHEADVVDNFVAAVEAKWSSGPAEFGGVAFIGTADAI